MKGRDKWSRVSVLTALLDEVKALIEGNPRLGYPNPSCFVNDAVRRLLEECRARTRNPQHPTIRGLAEGENRKRGVCGRFLHFRKV